ncbi:hypothetical protein TNCV_2022841 [Trichonephila clavipes]|nr:hypothetical protein TNCV_2022841 [Trichonephila clavipes]
MIPAYSKKRRAAFHSRRESVSGKGLTSFPEENMHCLTFPEENMHCLTRDSNPNPLGYKPRVRLLIRFCFPDFGITMCFVKECVRELFRGGLFPITAPAVHNSAPSFLAYPDPTILHANCQVIYSQFGLAIHQNDHQARRTFVEWAQNEIAVVPDFHKRILFSDEAPFWLNGSVNKQNCRIWSEANPQVYVETPLHPEKLTVWCALWAGGILLQKR